MAKPKKRRHSEQGEDDVEKHSHVIKLAGHNQAIRPDHGLARGQDALLAVGCERDVGAARMLAAQRPLGLAVADDEDFGRRHGLQGGGGGVAWCVVRVGRAGRFGRTSCLRKKKGQDKTVKA